VRFAALRPKIFENLRNLHDVSENNIKSLFNTEDLRRKKLKIKLQSGKGGAFFIIPIEGNFLIKSITAEEYDVMAERLANYYLHFLKYPNTCITAIHGCYALRMVTNEDISPLYFILRKNILPLNINRLTENAEMYSFDIKGSTAGRKVLSNPKEILRPDANPEIQHMALKDDDFFESFSSIQIPPTQNSKIIEQLAIDAAFFEKYNLIDYSLLVFIANIPCNNKGEAQYKRTSYEEEVFRAKEVFKKDKNSISPFVLSNEGVDSLNKEIHFSLVGAKNEFFPTVRPNDSLLDSGIPPYLIDKLSEEKKDLNDMNKGSMINSEHELCSNSRLGSIDITDVIKLPQLG